MGLPRVYRKDAPVIATYDYTDLAEGTGIEIFYGTHAKVTTVDHYLLLGTAVASNEIQTHNDDIGTRELTKLYDLDFDTAPFNLPKNIKGTAYISIPLYTHETAGTSFSSYIIAKIRKWDGTPGAGETEIASAQSETQVPSNGTSDDRKKLLVKIAVPLTHFKKGETLRLTIEVWVTAGAAGDPGDAQVAIGHDPKGRATTQFPGTGDYKVTTVMEAHIPFRIPT